MKIFYILFIVFVNFFVVINSTVFGQENISFESPADKILGSKGPDKNQLVSDQQLKNFLDENGKPLVNEKVVVSEPVSFLQENNKKTEVEIVKKFFIICLIIHHWCKLIFKSIQSLRRFSVRLPSIQLIAAPAFFAFGFPINHSQPLVVGNRFNGFDDCLQHVFGVLHQGVIAPNFHHHYLFSVS